MPEPTRLVIAAELRAALQDAIEIDENEVTAIYHLRTGRMPRRVEREERAQQKRPA